jgi:hypothetical protein
VRRVACVVRVSRTPRVPRGPVFFLMFVITRIASIDLRTEYGLYSLGVQCSMLQVVHTSSRSGINASLPTPARHYFTATAARRPWNMEIAETRTTISTLSIHHVTKPGLPERHGLRAQSFGIPESSTV